MGRASPLRGRPVHQAISRPLTPAMVNNSAPGNDDVIGVPGTRHIATFDDFAAWISTLR